MPEAPLHPDEPVRLQALRNLEILDTLPEAAYDDIAWLAADLCKTPIALISLVDDRRQWFKACHGLEVRETPRAFAFCAHAILTPDQPLIVSDATLDLRFKDNPLVTGEPGIRFYAGIPLSTRTDAMPVGTLCVISDHVMELTERQYHSLRVLANHAEKLLHLKESTMELLDQQRRFREQEHEFARLGRVALAGELVAEVSHEMGQPLYAMAALASALETLNECRKWDYDKTSTLIRKLLESGRRAGDILIRLRGFVRKVPATVQICDMNDILTSTAEFLEFQCRRHEVDITLNLAPVPLNVVGNKAHLQQVTVNLFMNALEAMDGSSSTNKSLNATARQGQDTVIVEISDTGPGLSVSEELAFSAFNSTKPTGLGMGLSICSRIIDEHAGTISARSRAGEGATFSFELPKAG
jgi:two-component system, NtrC family, sensor kinase